jgi:hypothetical protein
VWVCGRPGGDCFKDNTIAEKFCRSGENSKALGETRHYISSLYAILAQTRTVDAYRLMQDQKENEWLRNLFKYGVTGIGHAQHNLDNINTV